MIEWIRTTDRMPTQQDADDFGCVIAWHEMGGLMVMGWHRVAENRFIVAWAPTPEGPGGEREGEI